MDEYYQALEKLNTNESFLLAKLVRPVSDYIKKLTRYKLRDLGANYDANDDFPSRSDYEPKAVWEKEINL